MPGIFISYRRESAAAFAGRLWDHLAGKLGSHRTFMDVDIIEPGEDFVEILEKKLTDAVAMVVLIGPDWLTCADPQGNRRLDNPADFVRLEVAAALRRRVRVIPVLFDGAQIPTAEQLPEDLKMLSRRQAMRVNHIGFHQDVARLLNVLEKLLTAAEEGRTGNHLSATGPLELPAVVSAPVAAAIEFQRSAQSTSPDESNQNLKPPLKPTSIPPRSTRLRFSQLNWTRLGKWLLGGAAALIAVWIYFAMTGTSSKSPSEASSGPLTPPATGIDGNRGPQPSSESAADPKEHARLPDPKKVWVDNKHLYGRDSQDATLGRVNITGEGTDYKVHIDNQWSNV